MDVTAYSFEDNNDVSEEPAASICTQKIVIFIYTAVKTTRSLLHLQLELRNLYSSPSIIRMNKSRRMRWVEHVTRMGDKRNAYRILMGEPQGKRQLERPKFRWMDNIVT
jgi:hypothetical protein